MKDENSPADRLRRAHPLVLLGGAFVLVMCSGRSSTTPDGGSRDAVVPAVACQTAADCELPESVCLDASTLQYYVQASCEARMCHFETRTMSCGCRGNGCVSSSTTGGSGVTTTTSGGSGPLPGPDSGGPSDTGVAGSPGSDASDDGHDAGGTVSCQQLQDCVPPPSMCADANTLRYWVAGRCKDNLCGYVEMTLSCTCRNGGCQSPRTAAAPGPRPTLGTRRAG